MARPTSAPPALSPFVNHPLHSSCPPSAYRHLQSHPDKKNQSHAPPQSANRPLWQHANTFSTLFSRIYQPPLASIAVNSPCPLPLPLSVSSICARAHGCHRIPQIGTVAVDHVLGQGQSPSVEGLAEDAMDDTDTGFPGIDRGG
jgi:hypothetical protein